MNLYHLLNLVPTASPDEIERAYRRLARRYHPGINPGDPRAGEVYRQIQQAYAVLIDPERRREYDRGGLPREVAAVEANLAFEGFDFSSPAEGSGAATFSELFADVFQDAARRAASPERGADIFTTVQVSFEQAMRGGSVSVPLLRQARCADCGGAGVVPHSPGRCPQCQGQGTRRWARGHMVFTKPCEACDGSGRLARRACRACRGTGVSPARDVVTVAFPPGLESGARVVVPGAGHAGARGGSPGDLHVSVDVTPHPFFRREGRDLLLTVPVAVDEAALGARFDVPTLDGPVKVRIPPGSSTGRRLRLRGRGLPGPTGADEDHGDLVLTLEVVLPAVIDERSKALLQEFGRLNAAEVRRPWGDEMRGGR